MIAAMTQGFSFFKHTVPLKNFGFSKIFLMKSCIKLIKSKDIYNVKKIYISNKCCLFEKNPEK